MRDDGASANCSTGFDYGQTVVVIFRCTRKLLERLHDKPAPAESLRSTTALGDWYLNLIQTTPHWLVIGVSATARLPLVIPARNLETMAARFADALEDLLRHLGVSDEAVAAERREMADVAMARTSDRRVLGSLGEFTRMTRWALADEPQRTLHEISLRLSRTPVLPLKDFPDRMARRALEERAIRG